jgi:hypothetical protein
MACYADEEMIVKRQNAEPKNKKSLSGNPDRISSEEFVEVKVIPIFGIGFKAHSEKWIDSFCAREEMIVEGRG